MNGTPTQLTLSLGVSAKLSVEDLDEFYEGVRLACRELGGVKPDGELGGMESGGELGGVELAGSDIKASVNGLAISVNVVGTVAREKLTRRSGAHANDLICITRDLGAAYLGLHLLEREKRALAGSGKGPFAGSGAGSDSGSGAGNGAGNGAPAAAEAPQPKFEGYEYLLERQLKPRARKDIIDALATANIVPTAMTHISDGLASDLLQICRASGVGARIYLDRLPIARETYALAEELHIDPVVAALNGGDDHELLFTVPLTMPDTASTGRKDSAGPEGSADSIEQRLTRLGVGIEIIGHITPASTGVALTTPDGSDIPLKAQGFSQKQQ
jgi:thiamine-monophosphate kinase